MPAPPPGSLQLPAAPSHWVRAWAAALMAPESFGVYPGLGQDFHDVTLRQLAVAALPGSRLRVRLSNEFGSRPLVIGAAHLALSGGGAAIRPGSDRALTFDGQPQIIIPAGAAVLSDTAELETPACAVLAVSLHLPQSTCGSSNSVHEAGWQTGYRSPPGNFAGSTAFPVAAELKSTFFLSGIDVEAPAASSAVLAFGDSITDGDGSTPGALRSWPDVMRRRLAAHHEGRRAILNLAISGNRLLHEGTGPCALARFNRDVLAIPGARTLLVLEGVNDIGGAEWFARPAEDVSAVQLIGALRQLIDRAHQHGIRVIGGTLTPTGGCNYRGFDTAAGEAKRQAINAWIREGRAFDAMVDFDRAIRDPAAPGRIKAEYDSGDHLHLGDAGYEAMANAIDPSIL